MNENLITQLEELGEKQVQRGVISGEWGQPGSETYAKVIQWLDFVAASKRDAREKRTLLIACAALAVSVIGALGALFQILN